VTKEATTKARQDVLGLQDHTDEEACKENFGVNVFSFTNLCIAADSGYPVDGNHMGLRTI
jgi:hypothetical protein